MLVRVTRLDSVKLDSTYFTDEGYLIDTPVVTSTGIFEYKNPDGSVRRELRLPEHVFSAESLKTYEGKPIIITHDAVHVDKNNVEREHVGTILSEGYQDGDNVRCKIIIHGIKEVQKSGFRELSLGYALNLIEESGEWNGQPYDAIQTDIKVNHLALVRGARAGEHARLNIDGESDSPLRGGKLMKNAKKAMSVQELQAQYDARRRTRLDAGNADGKKVKDTQEVVANVHADTAEIESDSDVMAPSSASADDRLKAVKDRRNSRDTAGVPESPEVAMAQIIQQDEDIDELLSVIEELMAQNDFTKAKADEEDVIESESGEGPGKSDDLKMFVKLGGEGAVDIAATVDNAVRERTKLLRIGDNLNLDGLEDMSIRQIKAEIIKAVNPGMRLDGKGDHYINAAFDLAIDTMNNTKSTDRQRRQMVQGQRNDGHDAPPTGQSLADTARARMNERLMNGGNK